MSFPARIFGLLFALLAIFLVIKPTFAQTSMPQANQYMAPSVNSDVPQNLHTYTQNVVIEVMSSLICQISGIDPVNPSQSCLGIDPTTKKVGFVQNGGGAIGALTQGISLMYTPALHTGDYVHYLSQGFGIAKPSYAQSTGVGFNALTPLISIWSVFRNITYLFFVFIFVIIGLGIMLRVHIDARTVMTIQNQIPKIIIALILITFSFAIAGFLVDLMYISIYIIYGIMSGLPGLNSSMSPVAIQGQNILKLASNFDVWSIAHQTALSGKDTINGFLGVTGNPVQVGADLLGFFGSLFGVSNWSGFHVVDSIYNIISFTTSLKVASMIPCAGGSVPLLGGLTCVGQTALEAIPLYFGINAFLVNVLPYLSMVKR